MKLWTFFSNRLFPQNVIPQSTAVNSFPSQPAAVNSSPSQPAAPIEIKHSFEEFKLMYDSAEKVTDRRIANNKLNYSICVALLIGIAYLWNWSNDHIIYSYAVFTFTTLISFFAILFAWLWLAQTIDYKRLNTAKFKVMNKMAPKIFFDTQKTDLKIVSYNPFDEEWKILEDMKALQNKGLFKIVGLKSSYQEYFVTIAFIILFSLLLVASIVPIIIHETLFIEAWRKLLKI